MKHKVLGSVFVLAVALGMISVTMRTPQMTPTSAPKASAPLPAAPAVETAVAVAVKKDVPHMDRALASYRVFESGIERGMDFRGAQYQARVSETEVRFGNAEGSLLLGAPIIEQGARIVSTSPAAFVHPTFGVARLERGPVTEEYVFENRRMEQLFRIPAALGTGALTIRVPLTTTFPAVIENRPANSGTFDSVEFRDGGLAVLDATGGLKFACTNAVVLDSADHRLTLTPRHENGTIVLEVPDAFLAKAAYPVVVDPWFSQGTSSTFASALGSGGGGLSQTAQTSDRPAMRDNLVAWSDHTSGHFQILARLWLGNGFGELAGSASGSFATSGDSLNPSVVSDGVQPAIAWEEITSIGRAIYVKQFVPNPSGIGTWQEKKGSATGNGVSANLFANIKPSVGLLRAVVPGLVSIDPTTGLPISSPATHPVVPVVAWESGAIYVSAYYPGAPAIPPTTANPQGAPLVPEGWYQLNVAGSGANVSTSFNSGSFIGFGENLQLVVDGQNQVTVAWDGILGNFEIQASRWTLVGAPPTTEFQVIAASLTQYDMRPQANFRGIATAGLSDNVSNTATPSQYPSLCLDGAGGLAIAWQETEAAAPPNPGTSSQIYVLRSAGPPGSAWTPLAGSASPGGISRTGLSYDGAGQVPPVPGNASTPSIAAGGGYLGVAWADTSNSRSSIYVRRCPIGGTSWDQIGFQGSAFPPRLPIVLPPPVPEPAPINGVSKSPNFAFQPQLQLFSDGSPLVVWADGSGSTFDILGASFSPQGPGQAVNVGTPQVDFQLTIRQTTTDPSLPAGATDIPVGGFTSGSSVFISSRVFSEVVVPAPTSMWLEIELQPAGIPFTLHANYQALFVLPDFPPTTLPAPPPASLCVLQIDGLPNDNYHFITRTRDNFGRVSAWFQQTDLGGVAFRVNNVNNGPVNNTTLVAGGTKNKGSCGLLGLEALAALGLIRLLRRKRSK